MVLISVLSTRTACATPSALWSKSRACSTCPSRTMWPMALRNAQRLVPRLSARFELLLRIGEGLICVFQRCLKVTLHLIIQEQVMTALASANCTEFVQTFADGIDHSVGELGTRLSGGQVPILNIIRCSLSFFLASAMFLSVFALTCFRDSAWRLLVCLLAMMPSKFCCSMKYGSVHLIQVTILHQ